MALAGGLGSPSINTLLKMIAVMPPFQQGIVRFTHRVLQLCLQSIHPALSSSSSFSLVVKIESPLGGSNGSNGPPAPPSTNGVPGMVR